MVLQRLDHTAVVSHALREVCIELGADPKRISVSPMGVDLRDRFIAPPSLDRDPARIVFVGRLAEKKGVRYLIDAMKQVVNIHPQARLTVVGDGAERSALQQRTNALGLANHIEFVGAKPAHQIPAYYRNAAISVMPSVVCANGDQEGLGLVAVEAMGCGCAMVASDLRAVRDSVIDGQTGLMARPKSSADLSRHINTLIAHPGLAQRLARQGRAHCLQQFDWSVVSARYRDRIHALIARQPLLETSICAA